MILSPLISRFSFIVFVYCKYSSLSVDLFQTASASSMLPWYFTVNTENAISEAIWES